MIRILQVNLNTSKEAQALALQSMVDYDVQVLITSEPNKIPHEQSWIGSTDNKCAIYLNQNMEITRTGKEHGFVWIEAGELRIYSCYISPNCSAKDFSSFLDSLEQSIQTSRNQIILAGDFNSHAPEWGSRHTCSRGKMLLEMTESLT